MSASIRQDLWGLIDYNTILYDHWNKRRVVIIGTDEVIDRGWAQPCYGKNDRWDRAPNYLNIKVLSCDDADGFVQDWKITVHKDGTYGRIHTQEDYSSKAWSLLSTGRVCDGHDYFCSAIDVL